MKIVVLDGYALNPGDLSWSALSELGECVVYDRTAPEKVLERSEGAEVLLTNKTVLDAACIAALPELKYIGVLATGYNVVDVEAARNRGIVVTNIPAYSTQSVAQMVFAHLLNITNRVAHYASEVRAGQWERSADFAYWDTPLMELDGLKMGIVGLGHTGMATARLALAFGMEVYQSGNIPDEDKELSSERVIIIAKSQSPEAIWKNGFVEVNLCVPDMDGKANLIRLQELERKAQEILDDVVGEFDGSSYYYSIDQIGTEADTALKCHYVNVRLLFQVLNVK